MVVGSCITAFSWNMWMLFVGRFIMGLGAMVSSVVETTVVQKEIPTNTLGRVFAMTDVALQSMAMLSMGMAALLVNFLSVRNLFILSSVSFCVAALTSLIVMKEQTKSVENIKCEECNVTA